MPPSSPAHFHWLSGSASRSIIRTFAYFRIVSLCFSLSSVPPWFKKSLRPFVASRLFGLICEILKILKSAIYFCIMSGMMDQLAQMPSFFATGVTRTYVFRREQLLRLKEAILKYEGPLHAALHADLKKSAEES